MPPINLTEGAIAMLSSGDAQGTDMKPVLQVADIRLVNTQKPNNNELYRILLSDGSFTHQVMLSTQRNDLVRSEKLQKGSIVQLTQFVCNNIQNRMIIIIIELDVIYEKCDPIGEPKQYPIKTDGNVSSVTRSSTPSQSMNQPAGNSGNLPSYGAGNPPSFNAGSAISGSAPRPILGGEIHVSPSGGEIRVTCFNAVADQFYHQIKPDSVYMISNWTLKPAQKAFNHLRNDREIMLDSTSTVQPCFEDDKSLPQQQFLFRPISDIEGLENNSVVDVIGIVSSISPFSSIMRTNGTETQKRTLHLKDMSGRSVELTMWGDFCTAEGQTLQNMRDTGVFPVLAVKSCRVSDFNGKSVGTISSSQLFIDPDFPEAQKLTAWFNNDGKSTPAISISRETNMVRTDVRNKTISQIKDEKLGVSEKPDWITVSATLTFIKNDNFCYTACPIVIGDRKCSKKVTKNGDGKWRCERCDQLVDECDYRYSLQMQIQDQTGLTWVTAFQESGEEIMGISAKDLYYLKHEEQDDDKFAELVRNVLFTKFVFKLKVKEEIFSNEQRVKLTVIRAEKLNFQTETRYSVSLPPKSENIIPSGLAPTGSSGMYMSCGSCGGSGHNSANCPSLTRRGPGKSYGTGVGNKASAPGVGAGECFKCHQSGHWAKDCPLRFYLWEQ